MWTRQFYASSDDYGYGVAVSSVGLIYVTGMADASLNGEPYAGRLLGR